MLPQTVRRRLTTVGAYVHRSRFSFADFHCRQLADGRFLVRSSLIAGRYVFQSLTFVPLSSVDLEWLCDRFNVLTDNNEFCLVGNDSDDDLEQLRAAIKSFSAK